MSAVITRKKQTVPRWAMSFDCETSGLIPGKYVGEHQMISFGAVIFDCRTYEIIDKLYVEIQFDESKKWDAGAERVHGLSREHLKKHGISEEDALVKLLELQLKYFGPEEDVLIMAHNPNFDKAWLQDLYDRYEINAKIWFRAIDTCAIAMAMLGVARSDDLYEACQLPKRAEHNALEDALYSVYAMKYLRTALDSGMKATKAMNYLTSSLPSSAFTPEILTSLEQILS